MGPENVSECRGVGAHVQAGGTTVGPVKKWRRDGGIQDRGGGDTGQEGGAKAGSSAELLSGTNNAGQGGRTKRLPCPTHGPCQPILCWCLNLRLRQVEHYTLDYAMSLMPYSSTWQLAAHYLAWCPSHGLPALRLLLERLPLSVRGGDSVMARKVCLRFGPDLCLLEGR